MYMNCAIIHSNFLLAKTIDNGKRVVLVLDAIARIHDTLLYAGKNKTYATISEKHHEIRGMGFFCI